MSATATPEAASRPPFQHFLDAQSRPVLAFLRSMVGHHDAEDCFQETFIAALRAYDRMDGAHPRAWVMTIARRKAIDHHRARARRPEPRDHLPEPVAPANGAGGVGDLDGEVWAAVAELSESQRTAVALRYAGDLAYREIAAILECSEDAARRRVADGLRALRQNIDREEATR
ncbi:MAG: RNA polymerase sigma factor [Vicinamibacteria bacterium]